MTAYDRRQEAAPRNDLPLFYTIPPPCQQGIDGHKTPPLKTQGNDAPDNAIHRTGNAKEGGKDKEEEEEKDETEKKRARGAREHPAK